MATSALLRLQNGSDVRGVALGEDANLTPGVTNRIAQAFVLWLAEKTGKQAQALTVGVGHDSRVTAQALQSAALSGIAAAGAKGVDCALCSTPAMFMGTVYPESNFDGAIMLTASHLPMDRNGMKFFTRAGGLDKPDITALLTTAEPLAVSGTETNGAPLDLLALYTKDLCEKICRGVNAEDYAHPLAGLHVAVDCGNGAGGFFVDRVLAPLGADTSGSRYLEPDGTFPNHIPNPENKQAMDAARDAVVQSGADLGIIFDTDVDRMSAVLANGAEINRDAIIAMMAAILAPEFPGGTIVTDSVTSDHLTGFLEGTLGLRHHRFKRGYKNVINESIRLNNAGVVSPLAIETSGHGALSENHFLDDGAYMAVRLLIAAANEKKRGGTLGRLIEALVPAFEAREIRIPVLDDDFARTGALVLAAFEGRAREKGFAVAPNSYEGVRITTPRGWMLLRLSLHDPLLPLNLEGNAPGDCDALCKIAKELVAGFPALDLSVFDR